MDEERVKVISSEDSTRKYQSVLGVWALSLGCAVGWGSFVMPGTTFLPQAGPVGTVIGMVIGAVVMFIIGINYSYLMNKYPQAGGTLTYSIKTFGYDHGFLSAWFLILVYVAIIWANASAFTLIARNLFGTTLQFGFHYQVLGYDVYMSEALFDVALIVIFGTLCIKSRLTAVRVQILLAILMMVIVVGCFAALVMQRGYISAPPAFAPEQGSSLKQIFMIVVLSPWAYAGFESVSNSTGAFRFSVKKTPYVMLAALICAAILYSFLAYMAVLNLPEGCASWTDYIGTLSERSGLSGLPTFFNASFLFGGVGVYVLGLAAMAGIITGLVGNYIAAGRLLCSMAEDKMLPAWFLYRNKSRSPQNALLFLMAISIPVQFLGRTAIGWIVDVNTIGATIAYAYTSAAALANAEKERKTAIKVTGALGLVISLVFFFYFMAFSAGAMSTESYLILIAWSILGFLYFRFVFVRDDDRRFGKSTVVWLGLLFLIFFTSLMWVRQANGDMTRDMIENITNYYEEKSAVDDPVVLIETERYMTDQISRAESMQRSNSVIQMLINLVSLWIMFSIYSVMSKREKQMGIEKAKAEESTRAKSTFLSNMSHDIRTPMNAIVGYVNLAQRDEADHEKVMDYIEKIKTSSQHLLALINDVLEMSRIESGRVELEPAPMNLAAVMEGVRDMFSTQMEGKKISFTVDYSQVKNRNVYCDRNRLNRVLLNLVSNSWKFTPEGGSVDVILRQTDSRDEGEGVYELSVADSGMGMSKEFAEKVFEAFERERTSTVSSIQGTGLGMAITKSIVDMMEGDIEVITEVGQGTEFIIRLTLKYALDIEEDISDDSLEGEVQIDFRGMRVLLVEDMDINRELATMQLKHLGLRVETASNGREAVDKIVISAPGYYDFVLMDIQMPVLDGYGAAREIRSLESRELSGIPIIAMTANAFAEDVKKAKDAGMDDHIAKPIDVAMMTKTITSVLRSKKRCRRRKPV